MKKIALTICALSIVAFSFAQKSQEVKLDKSKLQFNAGIGLSTWGLPIYVGADYWLQDNITIGLEASFRYRFLHAYKYGYIGGSINGNFHFAQYLDLADNIDLYAGISAGPYIGFGNYYVGSSLNVGFGGQVGGRYKINDKLWINAEFGGGTLSGGKFGITIRR